MQEQMRPQMRQQMHHLSRRLIFSCSTTVDFGFGLTHADTGDPAMPTEGILALLRRLQKGLSDDRRSRLQEIPRPKISDEIKWLILLCRGKKPASQPAVERASRFCQPRGTLTKPANPPANPPAKHQSRRGRPVIICHLGAPLVN